MDNGFIIETRGMNKIAHKMGTKQYTTTLQ